TRGLELPAGPPCGYKGSSAPPLVVFLRGPLRMKPLGIALIGCGTVGTGVARLLLEHPDRLAARAGRPLALRRVVVRDPGRRRDVPLPPQLLTTDLRAALTDPAVDVAVEVVGGVDWARRA